jgi:threonyl-tRNA synthetase
MNEIVAEDQPFERQVVSQDEARKLFADQPLKLEIIDAVDPGEIGFDQPREAWGSVYRNLDFVDLCRGPHLPSTGRLAAFKLLRSAGAYWRGDEHRQQLQRIYGTAWESPKALSDYLVRLEEAERRDHRKLGAELDLYSFPRELGPGLAVWHPNGGMLRKIAEDHSRRLHEHYGFDFVYSPHLAREHLWEISGHLDYYAENMFPRLEVDEDDFYRVKPMNCPFHILIYKNRGRSYRELPLRYSELGGVYRHERSGVLHGLLRVRGFTQDDSHTFCRPDQLASELALHLDFVIKWLGDFGFSEFEADLSTRPEKSVGPVDRWDEAEKALKATLDEAGIDYRIAEGEGAFYGPKIDVHVRDAIGRRWQCSTIQVDFNNPERFQLSYVSSENEAVVPYMIHCAKAGSIDRFLAVVVEHHAGAFPGWLAPVQVEILPVAERHLEYAESVKSALREEGLRVDVDYSNDTLGEKIRRALTQKRPYVAVVGDKDVSEGSVGLRRYGEERDRRGIPLRDAVAEIVEFCRAPSVSASSS